MTQITGNALQAPTKRKLAMPQPKDTPKIPRIPHRIRAACHLLLDGQVKTVKDAAAMLGCTRTYLSRMLNKPHVEDYFAREEKRKVAGHTTGARAAAVFVGLLDSESDKVKYQVSSDILAMRGIAPPRDGRQTNVNVQVQAGYIVNWRPDTEPPIIEAKAEIVEG